MKAKVTVVVRNSLPEEAHNNGPLKSGIIAITQYAAAPLSHFLAARRRNPTEHDGHSPFSGLSVGFPRAWAGLSALTDVFAEGGRLALRLPAAPVPELPSGDEVIQAKAATHDQNISVFSAIDDRFDQRALDTLRQAMAGDLVLCTSALSRYSRNSAKLHRTLEILLAHGATILTTNYLIRPTDVWVRRGQLIKPVSNDPYKGIAEAQGLSGAHRNLAATVTAQLRTSQ